MPRQGRVDVLAPPSIPSTPAVKPQSNPWRMSWPIGLGILFMVRMFAFLVQGANRTPSYPSNLRGSPPSWEAPTYEAPKVPGREPPPISSRVGSLKQRVLGSTEEARVRAWYMLGTDAGRQRLDYEKVAAEVDEAASAAEREDCKALGAAMKKLKSRMHRAEGASSDETLRIELEGLERAVGAFCAAKASVVSGAVDGGAAADGDRGGGAEGRAR